MNLTKRMSLRWRLLAGFLLAAGMTVLSGLSGVVSLQRIQNHMSYTSNGVHKSVRHQTEETNSAIRLRDIIDEISDATTDYKLKQIESTDLNYESLNMDGNSHERDDLPHLLSAKQQELSALKILTVVDKSMASHFDELNNQIVDIVDSVTFAVLLGIEDAMSTTDGNNLTSSADGEEMATYVDMGLTKIKSALTARASLLELNLIIKETLLSQDPEVPKSSAVLADNLYTNLTHQLSPLSAEEGTDRMRSMIQEIQSLTPKFLEAKTGQILATQDFKALLSDMMSDVRLRSLTVVSNAETLEADVRKQFEESRRFATKSMVFLVIISLVAFVMSILIGVHMARSFGASITAVVTRVKDVADGDLTQRSIEANSTDEIGMLASHFNGMVKNLKEILGGTQQVANQINSAGQEILSISEAQAAGAREQSCAVSQTSSAAAELSKTSEQIGENIKTISQMANHVLAGMEKIKSATDQTNQILMSLNEKSKQIGNITELIDDVADQTNLLAVNASIEAARAGEQGRGFTVVADQIGKLADSTAKSTKDITGLVEMIQHEMSNAIIAMEQSLVGVEEEIQLAKDSAAKSQEIAMSANQQISGSRQIAEAMASIDQTMKQIVYGSQRSSEAASQLTSLADELKDCMGQFRVNPNAQNNATTNRV